MRRHSNWFLLTAAVSMVALPPWLSNAQPVPQPPQGQPVTEVPSLGDITIRLNELETRLLPIAIPEMLGPTGAQVAQIVSNDLRLSALFRVLDPRAFTANLQAEALTINAPSWTSVGATAVVKGQTTGTGDATRVELRVWEPGRPQAPVLTRTYGPGNIRATSHRIANDLIQLYTHTSGVFGTRIAFSRRGSRGRGDVYSVDCDGENLAQHTAGRRVSIAPAWGPGGLYFSSQTPAGFWALFQAGRAQAVLTTEGVVYGAGFGGGRMAVVLNRSGDMDIFTGNTDGSNLRNITNNPAIDTSPVFSPDGSRIAFVSDRAGGPQVYVMDSSGGGARRVSFAGNYNTSPSWGPDSQTLVYSGRTGGGSDIFSINVGSGSVRRLTEAQGSNTYPTMSPDGRLIAFSSSRGGIFLMNQDGLNQQRILAGGGESLRWSPR